MNEIRDEFIACPFEPDVWVNIAYVGDALDGGVCELAGHCSLRCGYNRIAVAVELPVIEVVEEVA